MKSLCSFLIKTSVLVTVFILFIASGTALGAGFALVEQGVSGLGNAYAGGAASAEDATTVFFNPAGLTRLDGQQFIAGAHIIMPSVKFHNEGSTHLLQGITHVPLLGGNGGEGGVTKVIPNMYFSKKIRVSHKKMGRHYCYCLPGKPASRKIRGGPCDEPDSTTKAGIHQPGKFLLLFLYS